MYITPTLALPSFYIYGLANKFKQINGLILPGTGNILIFFSINSPTIFLQTGLKLNDRSYYIVHH
jgi:hypothetical protein